MTLWLHVLGTRVDVHFGAGVTSEMVAEIRRAWSRCLDEGSGQMPGDAWDGEGFSARILAGGRTSQVIGESFAHFASELTSAITLQAIEARGGELLMLHASGLADPVTGRTAALVGPSGVGKTTATATLATQLGYVSDETVGIDRSGSLASYPKPLSVIVEEPPAPKRQIGPDQLGLCPAPPEARLAAVVLLNRTQAVASPHVEPLDHAEAIIDLAPHTSSLARVRRPLQWLCSVLDACGGAVRLTYREASDLAPLVRQLLSRPAEAREWAAVDDGAPVGHLPGLLRRADVVDAVELPGDSGVGSELLVMVDQRVVRLGGIAPAIWRALATPGDVRAVAERIAPELGLPEGYEELLERAITELEGHGVVARDSVV